MINTMFDRTALGKFLIYMLQWVKYAPMGPNVLQWDNYAPMGLNMLQWEKYAPMGKEMLQWKQQRDTGLVWYIYISRKI